MTDWFNPPGARTARDADGFREVVETIVFVVVLVLLLKTFAAEAFVIPTGSMATTLWGYQKYVECPQCGYRFPVNCSKQVEAKPRVPVIGCTCPNCRYQIDFPSVDDPSCNNGDRVLVAKSLYDVGLAKPERLDVVVFKYPEKPQTDFTPTNYIKRLIGLPGETIGIYYGKLYVIPASQGPQYDDDAHVPWQDLWKPEYMHTQKPDHMRTDDPEARELAEQLQKGTRFEIVRKSPAKMLALRRIVYDNDHPAKDLVSKLPPRWAGAGSASGWAPDENHGFRYQSTTGDNMGWLRYRHIVWETSDFKDQTPDAQFTKPELITDFMGYNSDQLGQSAPPGERPPHPVQPPDWVGDLMLECEVTVDQPAGELVLELSKGQDRFRARWDLSSGTCILVRVRDGKEEKLADKTTDLGKKGTHHLRFADFDEQLVVWVDNSLPFGNGVAYDPPRQHGPFDNDLEPASIGARGSAIAVHQLQLWRDTYYTLAFKPGAADAAALQEIMDSGSDEPAKRYKLHELLSSPEQWDKLRDLKARTMYVQPEHLLCMGDNSPQSYDGRSWGLVPRRLLLGRALLVYFPFKFPYWPLNAPVNRVGTIK